MELLEQNNKYLTYLLDEITSRLDTAKEKKISEL